MESDAQHNVGMVGWMCGFALAATTSQTHCTPISLSRTGFDLCGEVGNRIGGLTKKELIPGRNVYNSEASCL